MATKRYESIYRRHRVELALPDGKGVSVEFFPQQLVGGSGAFCTDREDLQKAIEDSVFFKDRIITLTDVSLSDNGNVGDDPNLNGGGPNGIIDYPEYTTFQGARNFLLSQYPDLSVDEVKSKAVLIATAEKLGIGFSNLK